ncbi:nucleotidyltransferase domain-containing protein [Magnetovirga frankeli]|uniref:nucleotidyltransferase domain-containing protein n=1 Tax=Magnetovirga frankeli TaxID=947516 RepID=UPI0012932BA0|nr:nucleotidyltransferase domain-containing protein [gamma proteobacterium SS-5]
MRLTYSQQEAIRSSVNSVIGAESRIWLFGSRANDHKQGGDIDLLIEPGKPRESGKATPGYRFQAVSLTGANCLYQRQCQWPKGTIK